MRSYGRVLNIRVTWSHFCLNKKLVLSVKAEYGYSEAYTNLRNREPLNLFFGKFLYYFLQLHMILQLSQNKNKIKQNK